MLSAPIAAVAAPGAAEASAASVEQVVTPACGGGGDRSATAAAIREQFRASFTAGAVTLPTTDFIPVICETS